MSTWFGKHDFQGNVRDSDGLGSASDNTNTKRNTTMFTTLRNNVFAGVRKTKNVTVGSDDTLTSVSSHALHLQLTKGQYTYFQDCSFADVSNSIFSTYTEVFNPDQCIPQVINTGDFTNFVNADLSNAYVGMTLYDDSCNVLDSSCANIRYAEIKQTASGPSVDATATLLELEQKKKKFAYPLPVNFSDICSS